MKKKRTRIQCNVSFETLTKTGFNKNSQFVAQTNGLNTIRLIQRLVRTMICMGYASLSADDIDKVKTVEKEMGVTLLAYEVPTYSKLNDDDMKKIKDLEKDLGLSLVAYEV